jgi:hypothetical protein
MADAPAKRPRKRRLRTLDDLDGRTHAARQARELVRRLTSDLGDDLTAAQAELVKRCGVLGAFLADCEARWLAGDPDVDLSAWMMATERQGRLLRALGLERRPRNVTPSLAEYIAALPASAKPAPREGPSE